MADEFDLSFSVIYDSNIGPAFPVALADVLVSQTTKKFVHHAPSIGVTEEALALGELSAPFGLFIGINRDDTNYLEIRSATGAANDIVKIPAGGFAVFFMGSDITAPYAIATTAACVLEYWLFAP